jgi:hypothetical protein
VDRPLPEGLNEDEDALDDASEPNKPGDALPEYQPPLA